MKEIKFRAWDSIHKKMLTIYRWDFDKKTIHAEWKNEKEIHNCGGGEEAYELLQFTGLKDKNGKEIYEGDIVRTILGKEKFVSLWKVFWGYSEDDYGTGWRAIAFDKGSERKEYWLEKSTCDRGEVIGNIYSNPELL